MLEMASIWCDRNRKACTLATAVIIVLLSLGLRLDSLDVFVTPDELKWTCRSINFHRALRAGDFAGTFQTGHPGVITMWLGVPWMGVDPTAEWLDMCGNPSISSMIENVSAQMPRELAALLFAARRGVALLSSLAIGVAFLMLCRLFGWRLALVSCMLVAWAPFGVAHSRFLHLDGIVTSFLFLSVLSLLVGLKEGKHRFLALSGVFCGLATLNKSPAMFGLPFTALVILSHGVGHKASCSRIVRNGVVFLLSATVTYFALWPTMWTAPGQSLASVFQTALFYAGQPHTNSNFFWGAPRPDPGWLFYPVALAFRLTPWALIGAALSLPWLVRRHERRSELWVLTGFTVLYGVFMTLGQKKFDRYLLPVFPFVQTLAGFGLLAVSERLGSSWTARRQGLVAVMLAAAVFGLGVTTALSHAPYYLTYYNPLLGGSRTAINTLLVGWGEGLDMAAGYLNAQPDAQQKRAVARALPDFAPFFDGRSYDESDYDPATTSYVVIYVNEVQRGLSPELLTRYHTGAEPLYVARLKGIDYAWAYENKTHEPPMRYIQEHADATADAIVVSRPSIFGESYDGPLPVFVIKPDWDREAILTMLQSVADQVERVWYVRYAEKNPNPTSSWIDFQWQTHTFLLDEYSSTDVDLFLWQTKNGRAFTSHAETRRDLSLRFGDALELGGYTLDAPNAQWGRDLGIVLEWRALRDIDQYYAGFVHVVDESGRRWGQGDHWIVNEDLVETVLWRRGDFVFDHLTVALNPGITPGTYVLVAGVYDRLTGEPLPIMDADTGAMPGIGTVIGTVEVASSPQEVHVESLPIQIRRDVELSSDFRLLGWNVDNAEPGFGETMSVALFWQATEVPGVDYRVVLELVDGEQKVWAEGWFQPAGVSYGTSKWRPGEILWRYYDLAVSENAPALEANLLLTLLDGSGERIGEPVSLGAMRLRGHHFTPPPVEHAQAARIGDSIQLLGFDVDPTVVKPGAVLQLTLYWRVEEQPNRSYTVFTHLLDPAGVVRAQKDSVPVEGRYPTSQWRLDEVVVDRYSLQLDPQSAPGDYDVEIGMYDPEHNAQRIPLFDGNGVRQPDDRLLLDITVKVEP